MTGQNKHIYTSEDIRRYHSGAMSQAEMHAMEKAALEDPFLADAMEGYVYSKDMTAELGSLQTKLAERTTSNVVPMPVRRRNFGWMRIAALFVVFGVAAWIIFGTKAPGKNETAMQKAPETQISDTKKTDIAVGNGQTIDDSATNETYVPVMKEQPVTAAAPTLIKSRQLSKNISRSQPSVSESFDVSSDTGTVASLDAVVTTETVVPQKAAARNDSYGYINPRTNTFNGVVTDDKNNAIPFASIIARNFNGTLTDNNGRFELKVPDTVSVVGVNAPGYLSRNIYLRDTKEQSQIVLQESETNTEEVVLQRSRATYDAKRNQPVKQTIVEIGELEPEGGWSEYNSYLADKLTPPKDKRKFLPTGVVELSFDVDDKGNPINITVEKSLCASCDKEAIRLLKEGPKWKKQEGKGKITIRF
jgi:hypothetical protein